MTVIAPSHLRTVYEQANIIARGHGSKEAGESCPDTGERCLVWERYGYLAPERIRVDGRPRPAVINVGPG